MGFFADKCLAVVGVAGLLLAGAAASAAGADVTADNLTVRGRLEVAPSGPAVAPTNGLMLYYSFDTNEAGIVTDLSGHGYTGTLYGPAWVSNGVSGGALDFDGIDDYVATARASCPTQTMSVWIRIDNGGWGVPTAHKAYDNWGNYHIYVGWSGSGDTLYGCVRCIDDFVDNLSFVGGDRTAWNHLALVSAGGDHTLYLNGNPVAAYTGSALTDNYPTYLGKIDYDRNGTGNFDGRLDEFRLYNRALSAEEVWALYACVRPASPAAGEARFADGVAYLQPLGDIPLGPFTNAPANPGTNEDFVVGNLRVQGRLDVAREGAGQTDARFRHGVRYLKPIGDLPTGIYTNGP